MVSDYRRKCRGNRDNDFNLDQEVCIEHHDYYYFPLHFTT